MRTIKLEVYPFDELGEAAKTRAIERWIEQDDLPFLNEYMEDTLASLLKQHKIASDDARPYYSLSYSQGDGAMFTGQVLWRVWSMDIRHSGLYYHEHSSSVWDSHSINTGEPMTDKAAKEWNELYVNICIQLRDAGYAYIESERDPENVAELIRANDYEFYADGSLI